MTSFSTDLRRVSLTVTEWTKHSQIVLLRELLVMNEKQFSELCDAWCLIET